MQHLKSSFFAALFAALFSTCVFGQQQSQPLAGTVRDPQGAVVSGARVRLIGSGKARADLATDAEGRFVIAGVSPGNYTLEVTAAGYPVQTIAVVVSPGGAPLDIRLSLKPVSANVEVTGDEAAVELGRVPGSTALIARRQVQHSLATNIKEVLYFTPGVVAQPRFGSDEMQISVRGSGLRNNYHLRGVNLLINGLPYGDADGFSDFESLEFLTADRVEVYKGANALRYGGNTAGGAIDLVTQTGDTAYPLELRVQGGSFGAFKGYGKR